MPSRHIVRTVDQADFKVPKPYENISKDFRRWCIVDGPSGSVHQEFSICELDPGGTVGAHVHTFEEQIYVLEGELICETGDGTYSLEPGDYGVIHVSAVHYGMLMPKVCDIQYHVLIAMSTYFRCNIELYNICNVTS